MFFVNFEISFVAGLEVIDVSFERKVKLVTMIGSHFTIVEDGLIG